MLNSRGEDINIGDIVTSYYKGYYKVVDIYDLEYELNGTKKATQVKLLFVLTSNFTQPNGTKNRSCDIDYCSKVTPMRIEKERKQMNENYSKLLKIVENK